MTLTLIDAHVHVWADGRDHAAPDHGTIDAPRIDAGIGGLDRAMTAAGIGAAVLVQYIGYLWDNTYVARAIAARPDRFAGVCRVDPTDPRAPDHLAALTRGQGFQGVRISPGPGPAGDWIGGPRADALLTRAAALAVPVVVLVHPGRLPDLIAALERNPGVDVVIDHLADCDPSNPDHRRWLERLARNPRVFLKTGHLWTRSRQSFSWSDRDDLLRLGLDLFGASRLMWGSDWPLCLRQASIGRVLEHVRNEIAFLTPADLGWIMAGTAQRLWRFAPAAGEAGPDPHKTERD